jgi:hypothetical protein
LFESNANKFTRDNKTHFTSIAGRRKGGDSMLMISSQGDVDVYLEIAGIAKQKQQILNDI